MRKSDERTARWAQHPSLNPKIDVTASDENIQQPDAREMGGTD